MKLILYLLKICAIITMDLLAKLGNWLFGRKREANILCVGLDNSGKSTIINKLKPENSRQLEIVPTVGFSVEKVITGRLSFTVFDMSGQGRYRNLWGHYYGDCDAIIFVIDSTDKIRLAVAKEELNLLLCHNQIKKKTHLPILFFANKSDLRESVSAVKCAQLLELDKGDWTKGGSPVSRKLRNQTTQGRPWNVCESNALTGDGLKEGITWITDQLIMQNKS